MALNKAQTSLGVKIILIMLIVAFVASFIPLFGSVFSSPNTGDQTAQPNALDAISQQFQPAAASLTAQLQSEPESYTVLVQLGNTYFDWALQVQQASTSSTETLGADLPLWTSAKDAYARAIETSAGESPVAVDYAITLFYTGDTKSAVEVADGVVKADPGFAPAYFNLGVFHKTLGDTAKAVQNYEKYLELDPEGRQGNADFAKQELEALRTGGTAAP